ncbi:hypothetical protein [Candidatus Thiosymbion oneisti]|uniref:hypothetical protein n=1 Tax=Candidatus Thiosymbion oneisti TaxID=589554 RepID=UPI000A9E90EB|nr:hypothetical protein [Candidatus Thiosymbion oneisti]
MKNMLAIIVIGLGTVGCASINSPDDPYFMFQHERYRTKAAHAAFIGSIGILRRLGRNHFEIKAQPEWEKIEVTRTADFALDAESVQEIKANAESGKVLEKFGELVVSTDNERKKGNKGKFSIFQITNLWELRDELNRQPKLLRQLASDGDYRIVLLMAAVYDHNYYKDLEGETGVKWTLTNESGVPKLSIDAKRKKKVVLNYNDGTRVAYQIGRFCWVKDERKIYEILVDLPGLDFFECPRGSGTWWLAMSVPHMPYADRCPAIDAGDNPKLIHRIA